MAFELLQVPSEFEQLLAIYKKHQAKSVLEIGCWDGGTLREWIKWAAPSATFVAVDPAHRRPDDYQGWLRDGDRLFVGDGESQSEAMLELMRAHAPYDWVFIDGDHDAEAVGLDVRNTEPLIAPGGIMVLHDVCPDSGGAITGPMLQLQELERRGFQTEVFDAGVRNPWTAGIGVVYF